MDEKNLIYALVPLAVFASAAVALGQLPASLSVPTPIAVFSAPSMAASLSAENSPGSLGAGGSGGRSRPATARGPSLPGTGSASVFGSQGSFVSLHAAASSSRASLLNGHDQIQQETWPTSVGASEKAGSSRGGFRASVFSTKSRSTMSSPRSTSSRSSIPEAPLYSLLANHDKGGSRSAHAGQGFSSRFGQVNSKSRFVQSLTGGGSGLGSSR
jgi:hypothetical protein